MITVRRFYRKGAVIKEASYPHATLASVSDHFRAIGCTVRRVVSVRGTAIYHCRSTDTGALVAEIETTTPGR